MTKQEIQEKSNNKRKAVEVLLNQLDLSLVAQQIVNKQGIIENMVFYFDNEKYPEEVTEVKTEKPDVKPTNL